MTADVALLACRDLSRTFDGPAPVRALTGATFDIGRGELVSIVGPSGSGKSTLLNVLGLLDRPTAGSYRVFGLETASLDERRRTALRGRGFGFVFQAFHLLADRTAGENVELGMLYQGVARAERARRAAEALERVGMAHRTHAAPATLSGGERQRTAVARALVGRPQLLLCDEPTGNLDRRTSDQVLDLLQTLNTRDGLTVLIVTHDAAVAGRASRHLVVEDGQVAEAAPSPR